MDDSELLRKKKEKIESLKAEAIELYPNDVRVKDTAASIAGRFTGMDNDSLAAVDERLSIAGRLIAIRDFGKGSFVMIQDRTGRLQAYIRKNQVGEKTYSLFKRLDVGDIVFVAGKIFRTRTNELTIDAEELRLLSKALRPLPEKWHGLTDIETRYRQRHLDLIVNPRVKDVFYKRSRIIQLIRRFMEERDFLEVETPMMQPKAGGAMARPFKTHRAYKVLEVARRHRPVVLLRIRPAAVAVTALVVAEHMADCGQRSRDRTVDPPEQAGGVEQHNRRSLSAPVDIVKPHIAAVYVALTKLVHNDDSK